MEPFGHGSTKGFRIFFDATLILHPTCLVLTIYHGSLALDFYSLKVVGEG